MQPQTRKIRSASDIVVLAIAIVSIAAFFFLHKAGNSDLFWQLKTGEIIWQNGSIPRFDIFSSTAYGNVWINHEWLAELIFYGSWKLGGFAGLSILSFLLGLAIAVTVFFTAARLSRSDSAALVLTFALFFLCAPRFGQLRPELFGFLFFALTLSVISSRKAVSGLKLWAIIPLLGVWANIHASVLAGLVAVMIYAAVRHARHKKSARPLPMSKPAFAVFVILCLLAPAVNPFGFNVYSFPIGHLSHKYALAVTSDWISPSWMPPAVDIAPWGLALLVAAAFVVFLLWRRRPDVPILLVAIVSIVPAFLKMRFIPFAAIAWTFLFAGLALRERRIVWGRGLRPALVAALLLCIGVPFMMRRMGPVYGVRAEGGNYEIVVGRSMDMGIDEEDFPVGAAHFISKMHFEDNMFNDMAWGGYFIWKFWPDLRVFIDTRTPVYGEQFLKEYTDALFDEAKFEELAAKYSINFVVYDLRQINAENGPLKFLINNRQWMPAFRFDNAAVFVRATYHAP